MQRMLALDMEGVLTPEIWVEVAKETGVDDLVRTTRDEPDYEKLMQWRIGMINKHGITASMIVSIVNEMRLLPGAAEFLDKARSLYGVIILSDTFEEIAYPLLDLMGRPHTLCNRIDIFDDRFINFKPRMQEAKMGAVQAYRKLNYHVSAVGDSYNDLSMIQASDYGVLFRPPQRIIDEMPGLPCTTDYEELLEWLAINNP